MKVRRSRGCSHKYPFLLLRPYKKFCCTPKNSVDDFPVVVSVDTVRVKQNMTWLDKPCLYVISVTFSADETGNKSGV